MRGVNLKNVARSENNDMNNKSALVKHVYSQNHHMDWNNSKFWQKKQIIQEEDFWSYFFIHSNNYACNDKSNCFYPTAYHN